MSKLNSWRKLLCSKSELRLDITLKCGQSFRWKLLPASSLDCLSSPAPGPVYAGVLHQKLMLLAQDEENVWFCAVTNNNDQNCHETEKQLIDYFQLDKNLGHLYQDWSSNDPIFEKLSTTYPGVRILRQDPVENVFSFICSANNNISRISSMVEKMCKNYGDKVCHFADEEYFSFPSLESLSQSSVEQKLRELGFGYRAKYIQQSAKFILDQGGESWLFNHRSMTYIDARKSLLQLSGVGPKVADCILLMSMDQPGAVPVDTHMFNIAKQYLPHLNKTKTVTDKVYLEIGDHFRKLYGGYAGWAHSVLFSADLKHIQKSVENHNSKLEIKCEEKETEVKSPTAKKKKKK